jgi:hypothetical protein
MLVPAEKKRGEGKTMIVGPGPVVGRTGRRGPDVQGQPGRRVLRNDDLGEAVDVPIGPAGRVVPDAEPGA